MIDESKSEKRKVGRPPKPMPELIPDTPENIARALFRTPPKKPNEWRYLRESESGESESEDSEDNEESDRR